MTTLQVVLAQLIRSGKVTVEIPNLDMDRLREAVRNDAVTTLEEIQGVVCEEEMTDTDKVVWIQKRLEQ